MAGGFHQAAHGGFAPPFANYTDANVTGTAVLFDKTGTLTLGRLSVAAIRLWGDGGCTEEALLRAAASGMSASGTSNIYEAAADIEKGHTVSGTQEEADKCIEALSECYYVPFDSPSLFFRCVPNKKMDEEVSEECIEGVEDRIDGLRSDRRLQRRLARLISLTLCRRQRRLAAVNTP